MAPFNISADGLCVASKRCIPTALDFCVSFKILSSISEPPLNNKSDASSTITTILGILTKFGKSLLLE